MAKFTAPVRLNIKWNGLEISGAAGATHRIPDAFVEEFTNEVDPGIPGGVTWITQDETSGIPTLPIAQSDVSNLPSDLAGKASTSDLAGKYDKTGGTISGAVTVTGALVAQSTASVVGLSTLGSVVASAVTATSGRFKGDPHFNVRAYGATGDGTTNDTTAIQNAIAAVPATGGTIFFPAGTYKIASALTLGPYVSLRGESADATIISSTVTGAAAISYTGTSGTPETGWGRYFAIRDLRIDHAGNSAAILLTRCLQFEISNVALKGTSATGHGLHLIDCYAGNVSNVRSHSFASGSAIRYESTGLTQPGSVVFSNVAGRYSQVGFDIVATAGVIDSLTFLACIVTDNTSQGVAITGSGGNRNIRFYQLHIEDSSTSNAQTGMFQSGSDCLNLAVEGCFVWGVKTPFSFGGTVKGLKLDGLYLNTNGHSSPGTAITASSNVEQFYLGALTNSSVNPYGTLLSDSSNATTKRKEFAGSVPIAQQASTTLTLGTSYADVTGATYSATTTLPERWLIFATIDFNVSSADPGLLSGVIVFDGATVGPTVLYNPGGVIARATPGTVHVQTGVSIGAHTLALQAKKTNAGGTATAVAANTRLVILRISE